MREIKYRAWVRFMQKMGRVNELNLSSGSALVDVYPYGIESDAIDLMQYTGLKDKSGVEIYEGDIFFDGIENCVIKWCKFSHSLRAFDGNEYHEISDWLNDREVIGNIHQNPELLA